MNTESREKQPYAVNGGAREHRTEGRSGPVTGANMVGRMGVLFTWILIEQNRKKTNEREEG